MDRTTIEELRTRRLNAMTSAEQAEFDEALAAARLVVRLCPPNPATRPSAGPSAAMSPQPTWPPVNGWTDERSSDDPRGGA